MNPEHFEKFLKLLNDGDFPAPTGTGFTLQQIKEIKILLEKRKKTIDDYYRCTILSRLSPLELMSEYLEAFNSVKVLT